jgi:GT2 family glycosyltransferase
MEASLVIPGCNSAKTLPLVLGSLNRQDFTDFEVVLVDDASSDDTSRIAQERRGGLDLKIIRHEENRGRAASRNDGIEQAQGRIILLLDSDVEVAPGYVSTHLALHRQQANAVGIGSVRYPDYLAGQALARYYVTRGASKIGPNRPLPGKYFLSGVASFPRPLFDQAGGFNLHFHFYGEDLELGLRFAQLGAKLYYLPQAIGYHHHLRPFKEVLELLDRYGRESLPRLVELHPEFAVELYIDDLLTSPPVFQTKALWRRLATAGVFFRPLAGLARALSAGPLPSPLLTYLFWAAYRRGFAATGTNKG